MRSHAFLIYMVASANGRPLHRAGCNRAWIWILMGSSDIKPSAAVELSPLLKERPSAAEAKAWCEDNMPKLPADQRAIILGLTPRGALQYDADPVPAALVEGTGVTAIMVTQRDALRFTIEGANAQKAKTLLAYNAELSNNLFTSIELAGKTNNIRASIDLDQSRYISGTSSAASRVARVNQSAD